MEPGELGNPVVAASNFSLDQSQRSSPLPSHIGHQTSGQGNIDGTMAFHTSKTFTWDRFGIHGLLHHMVAKKNIAAKVEVGLHEEEGM